jgi:hypothetical protein
MSAKTHPWVSLDAFEVDHNIQPRPYLNRDAVRRYTQNYRSDASYLPPIKLGHLPNGRTILIDGFHRVEAATQAGLTSLRAETIETTMRLAPWLAVDANSRHGVPIPRAQKREVFKRFVRAGQNRRPDGTAMSSREMAKKLPIASHTAMLGWMRDDFPKTYKEMVGDDGEDAPEENGDGAERLRDEVLGNLHWAQKQLGAAMAKSLKVITQDELAAFLRGAIGGFEQTMGRPMTTVEEVLDAVHGRQPEESADF